MFDLDVFFSFALLSLCVVVSLAGTKEAAGLGNPIVTSGVGQTT